MTIQIKICGLSTPETVDAAVDAGARAARARADDHGLLIREREQARDVRRRVLAVGVHNHQQVALGVAHARLDGATVANGVRMAHDASPRLRGDRLHEAIQRFK